MVCPTIVRTRYMFRLWPKPLMYLFTHPRTWYPIKALRGSRALREVCAALSGRNRLFVRAFDAGLACAPRQDTFFFFV